MSKPVRRNRVSSFFGVLGSAIAASAAVERRAQPEAQALARLGIDAEQFGRIGR